MEALQLFFTKGESTGSMSLTTPIALPPQIERHRMTQPNTFLAKARNASPSREEDIYMDLATGYELAIEIPESSHFIAVSRMPLLFLRISFCLSFIFIYEIYLIIIIRRFIYLNLN